MLCLSWRVNMGCKLGKPDHEYGYTSKYLKKQMKQFGPDCFNNFRTWMDGQTVTVAKNGDTVYYECDVLKYLLKHCRHNLC